MTLRKSQRLVLALVLLIAVGCSVYVAQSPGFALTSVLVTTIVAIALVGTVAFVLFVHTSPRAQEIGAALVSGVVFLLAAAMTQAAADVNSFRNSVAFAQDLHGFDPEGRSLRGLNFGGKDLSVANLSDADLREARLRQADLSTADLSGADLRGADLFYAQLHEADVHDADLRGANLRGAKLGTTFEHSLGLARLTGAKVSEETCWRIPRSRDKKLPRDITPTREAQPMIDFLASAGLVPVEPGRTIGHVCRAEEGEIAKKNPPTKALYVCPGTPFLRTEEMMATFPGRGGLYCSAPEPAKR